MGLLDAFPSKGIFEMPVKNSLIIINLLLFSVYIARSNAPKRLKAIPHKAYPMMQRIHMRKLCAVWP